jgi:hypothetical protein
MMGQHWQLESPEIKSKGHAYGLLVPKYLSHVEITPGDMCYWLPTTGDVCRAIQPISLHFQLDLSVIGSIGEFNG